ncbi:MAG: hypothetical protein DRP11_05045 [Candidatus Aenigmatarchaeota archaeon]|nr:MAG: hypothetical protein DRP11_05045 [Candidatus Aenigmarchaeota archaeon]
MNYDRILIRYGEVALKSDPVKNRFINRLVGNIQSGLDRAEVKYRIERDRGRLFVITKDIEKSIEILRKVFGIVSISPVKTTKGELEHIIKVVENLAKEYIREGETFAIRARRKGTEKVTSKMIEREAGAAVLKTVDARVDLTNPEKTIYVEVRQNKAFIFTEVIKCEGGMPLGTQGRVIGIFDGSVEAVCACWLMMKRGCEVIPVYPDARPYSSKKDYEVAERNASVLREWTIGSKFYLKKLDIGKAVFLFSEECGKDLVGTLIRRMVYRCASRVAKIYKAKAIVTGETLKKGGDVESFHLGEMASDLVVLRPLIGMDRDEILKLSERIGDLEECKGVMQILEERFKPGGVLKEIEECEGRVDAERLVEESISGIGKD